MMLCQSRLESHAQLCTRHETVHATMQHRPIEHVRQQHSWDCGLACALMVLRSFGINDVSLSDLHAQCATKSIWTIDLAHLLAKRGCNVSFFTVTVGANPEFASERFYARNMAVDRARVDRLFSSAATVGISINQCNVPWQDLRDLVVKGDCLAIVLVDKCKLRYTAEPPPEEPQHSGVPSCCCGLVRISYRGHYIVLTSWVEGAQAFRVEDPALAVATYVTAVSLDRARISYGTDEDILVVSRCRHGQKVPLPSGQATKPPIDSSAKDGQQQQDMKLAPEGVSVAYADICSTIT